MIKRITTKIRAVRGESIAETLIALLISALALLMLAGAIASSAQMVERGKATMKDYYSADSDMAAQSSGDSTDSGTVTLTPQEGTPVAASWKFEKPVEYYTNMEIGNKPVISYSLKP